jgi:hypothetical protein
MKICSFFSFSWLNSYKKIKYKKHKTTKERLVEFYGMNFVQEYTKQKEIDWGNPIGKEIW